MIFDMSEFNHTEEEALLLVSRQAEVWQETFVGTTEGARDYAQAICDKLAETGKRVSFILDWQAGNAYTITYRTVAHA